MPYDSSHDPSLFDPTGNNHAVVRDMVHRFIDGAIEWRCLAASRPDAPKEAYRMGDTLPDDPQPQHRILAELQRLLAHSANTSAPTYLAHMGAVSNVISAVGEFIAAAVNNNLIGLELSPSLSLLERDMLVAFAARFGLGKAAGGVITTGGSLSNLHALAVARNWAASTANEAGNPVETSPVLLASEAAHASIKKSAMILGLGREAAISVGCDRTGAMSLEQLRLRFSEATCRGQRPSCVVATAGTTVAGSIDPLLEIGAFAREHSLWFHVDAAWGGALQFSPTLCRRLNGIEAADSITFCPQKLFLVALSSSLVLFRGMSAMTGAFSEHFPYMESHESLVNRSEIGIQGSRPGEVLKLWLTMQQFGTRRLAQMVERWVKEADTLSSHLSAIEGVTVLPAHSGIVCFSIQRERTSVPYGADPTRALQEKLRDRAGITLSVAPLGGARWLRAVFANPFTGPEVSDAILATVRDFMTSPK